MISCSVNPSGYTKQNVTATIKIICNEGIRTIKQTEPTEETITASGTETTIVKENIEANTTFKYEVTDSKGNTDIKIAQITNIDKDEPSSCTITAHATDNGIEITATAEDAGSGIGRYEYYVNDEKKGESDKNTYIVENLASGTYSVYVIAYDKAENSKTSDTVTDIKVSRTYTNITAQMVADHPETYYGLKVTNYESTNGQDDWKIFYSDGEHLFLITGDYVDLSTTNEGTTKLDTNTGMTKIGTKYRAYWSNSKIPSSLQTNKDEYGNDIDNEVKTRFMANGYTLKNSYDTSRCMSALLNTSNWSDYKDNDEKAEYAIGGSTIEMWMASWNELCEKKYKKVEDKLYWKAGTCGYNIGTSPDIEVDEDRAISSDVMSIKDGYNNKLYYPRHEGVSDGHSSYPCKYYWLASPGDGSASYALCVRCEGYLGNNGYVGSSNDGGSYFGIRPVVSLRSGIQINATE